MLVAAGTVATAAPLPEQPRPIDFRSRDLSGEWHFTGFLPFGAFGPEGTLSGTFTVGARSVPNDDDGPYFPVTQQRNFGREGVRLVVDRETREVALDLIDSVPVGDRRELVVDRLHVIRIQGHRLWLARVLGNRLDEVGVFTRVR